MIESDPQNSAWLSQVLTTAGYQVQTAATAAEGLAKCQSQVFDAVTLNLFLPHRAGWQMLRGVRSTSLNHKTRVIVVSLVAEKEIGAAFLMDDFLAKPMEAGELVNALERAGAPPYGGKTVLVLDGDPNILKVIQATLGNFGYRALWAADGAAGLRIATAERPAVVILDLTLPGMDGFQFLDQYQRDPAAASTAILVWIDKDLSAQDYTGLERLAREVVLRRNSNARSILDQLSRYLPAALAARH